MQRFAAKLPKLLLLRQNCKWSNYSTSQMRNVVHKICQFWAILLQQAITPAFRKESQRPPGVPHTTKPLSRNTTNPRKNSSMLTLMKWASLIIHVHLAGCQAGPRHGWKAWPSHPCVQVACCMLRRDLQGLNKFLHTISCTLSNKRLHNTGSVANTNLQNILLYDSQHWCTACGNYEAHTQKTELGIWNQLRVTTTK